MMSQTRNNEAAAKRLDGEKAKLKKQNEELERELVELRQFRDRELRIRQAYAMSREANLPTTHAEGGNWQKVFVEQARIDDRPLSAILADILDAIEPDDA